MSKNKHGDLMNDFLSALRNTAKRTGVTSKGEQMICEHNKNWNEYCSDCGDDEMDLSPLTLEEARNKLRNMGF